MMMVPRRKHMYGSPRPVQFLLLTNRSRDRFPALPDVLVAVGLERGPLRPCGVNEELLERKVTAPI
jgi:hypothetical protein